jgi:hypothetical protein
MEGFLMWGLLIVLMMEAASTSETSVNFYQTAWCYNPEDNHLYIRCHENLKSCLGKQDWKGVLFGVH